MFCAPQRLCIGLPGRMTSGWPAEASFIPARSWQRLPGPRWLGEEAGTGCLCRRLHLEEWVGRRAYSRLYSPHSCPGQAPLSSQSFWGTIPVPNSQPGPKAADSGSLLRLGSEGELDQPDPHSPGEVLNAALLHSHLCRGDDMQIQK